MTVKIDARRLLCPLPVIRLQDAIEQAEPNELAEIVCTDPGVVYDIPAWCRINGHRVLDIDETSEEIVIRVRKSPLESQAR